mmetsp:Transcript_24337/g.33777  ORF Transcript_24337/g.33777 Transcript_24337/m.33777 type:complete len:116 (-) Transcript_24337:50-397(-)
MATRRNRQREEKRKRKVRTKWQSRKKGRKLGSRMRRKMTWTRKLKQEEKEKVLQRAKRVLLESVEEISVKYIGYLILYSVLQTTSPNADPSTINHHNIMFSSNPERRGLFNSAAK